jgi:hypothetical protein
MTKGKSGAGLHGSDKQETRLRDVRDGTYDSAGSSRAQVAGASRRTRHQQVQAGADVRQGTPGESAPRRAGSPDLPEGLRRQPKGPYDKSTGRAGKPARR